MQTQANPNKRNLEKKLKRALQRDIEIEHFMLWKERQAFNQAVARFNEGFESRKATKALEDEEKVLAMEIKTIDRDFEDYRRHKLSIFYNSTQASEREELLSRGVALADDVLS